MAVAEIETARVVADLFPADYERAVWHLARIFGGLQPTLRSMVNG
jgi:hypothetical protein